MAEQDHDEAEMKVARVGHTVDLIITEIEQRAMAGLRCRFNGTDSNFQEPSYSGWVVQGISAKCFAGTPEVIAAVMENYDIPESIRQENYARIRKTELLDEEEEIENGFSTTLKIYYAFDPRAEECRETNQVVSIDLSDRPSPECRSFRLTDQSTLVPATEADKSIDDDAESGYFEMNIPFSSQFVLRSQTHGTIQLRIWLRRYFSYTLFGVCEATPTT